MATYIVLDNVLQGGLQPRKAARRVHQDSTRAGCVTRLQTSRHGIAQVLVMPIAAVAEVVVVVVVVAVRGNNYLRGLWETFLVLLLLDVVGLVDDLRLLLLHLPPLPPLRFLHFRASLLLLTGLPLGGLALDFMLSSPSLTSSHPFLSKYITKSKFQY